MTEKIGVMSGDSISLKVPAEWVESNDHSFRSVTVHTGDEEMRVMLESGFTRLRVRGEPVVFDGFRYFPNVYESPLETKVDFEDDWGGYIDADHPAHDMTVRDLLSEMETDGDITPLPKDGDPR